MKWVRILVYEGTEDFIRYHQGRSLPEGCREMANGRIYVTDFLGGKLRFLFTILRKVFRVSR